MKKRGKNPRNRRTPSASEPSAESGRRVGQILRSVVREQIQEKKPPIVEATYRRLLRSGEDEKNAIELIATVLASQIYDMLNKQQEYDESKYAAALKRLPELPFESDA